MGVCFSFTGVWGWVREVLPTKETFEQGPEYSEKQSSRQRAQHMQRPKCGKELSVCWELQGDWLEHSEQRGERWK